jgi:hypothetical protein
LGLDPVVEEVHAPLVERSVRENSGTTALLKQST